MALNAVEKSCSMLVYNDRPASAKEIKEALESGDSLAKVEAMQKAISMILNGEQLPTLFITIVRYVLPSEDHTVQKLLLLYLVRPPFPTLHLQNLVTPLSRIAKLGAAASAAASRCPDGRQRIRKPVQGRRVTTVLAQRPTEQRALPRRRPSRRRTPRASSCRRW